MSEYDVIECWYRLFLVGYTCRKCDDTNTWFALPGNTCTHELCNHIEETYYALCMDCFKTYYDLLNSFEHRDDIETIDIKCTKRLDPKRNAKKAPR